MLNYIHYALNEEITAIGGHYVITKESKIPLSGREVLVTVGYGVMDTTCCGTGGCGYATVYGFIEEWKSETNEDGLEVSKVTPIRDEQIRKSLKISILNSETVQQVNFL
ncbi:hypothetical protein KJ966_26725 [bacterium]|nr:hypothetical protein [bacterium]